MVEQVPYQNEVYQYVILQRKYVLGEIEERRFFGSFMFIVILELKQFSDLFSLLWVESADKGVHI